MPTTKDLVDAVLAYRYAREGISTTKKGSKAEQAAIRNTSTLCQKMFSIAEDMKEVQP